MIPLSLLTTLRKSDSILQGHANIKVPGVDFSTGSLGQGISGACGMALAKKYKGEDGRVYTIVGDGECQEGEVWEAIHFAVHYQLSNLCILVDRNNLQIDGSTSQVMNVFLVDEFVAAGCNVMVIDGHDYNAFDSAFDTFHKEQEKPTIIVMKTIKGKGISFMEDQVGWHGKAPNDEGFAKAMEELGGNA